MTYAERRFELARQHGAGEITHKQWLEGLSLLINEEMERLEALIVDLHNEDYDLCAELSEIDKKEKEDNGWKWAKRYDELNGRPEGPEDY